MSRNSYLAWSLSLLVHLVLFALISLYALNATPEEPGTPIHVHLLETHRPRPALRMRRWRAYANRALQQSIANTISPDHSLRVPDLPALVNSALVPQLPPSGIVDSNSELSLSQSKERVTAMHLPQPQYVARRAIVRQPTINHVAPTLRVPEVRLQNLRVPYNPLERIALDAVSQQHNRKLDVVLLIDASQSMERHIRTVNRHLHTMISRLGDSGMDVRLGAVTFRHGTFFSLMGWDIEVEPLTKDLGRVKRMLDRVECIGGERALDAIPVALKRVKFREDADHRLVLITDEYVSGETPMSQVLREVAKRPLRVDVIGRDEYFQRRIVFLSGGIWQSIEDLQ